MRLLPIPALIAAALLVPAAAGAEVSKRNGNFFIGYTDIIYSGGFEPKVERVYNSKTSYNGMFGWGWGTDWDVFLSPMPDRSVVVNEYGGGARNVYQPANYGDADLARGIDQIVTAARRAGELPTAKAEQDYRARLASSADVRHDDWERFLRAGHARPPRVAVGVELVSYRFGYQVLTATATGYQRRFENGRREAFDLRGRPMRVWDANDNWVDLRHDAAGRLATVRDNFKRKLVFAYTPSGKVASIRGDAGRTCSYRYNDKDELIESRDVDGHVYRYAYDRRGRHNLVRIEYADQTSLRVVYYPRDRNENVRSVTERDGMTALYTYRVSPDGLVSRVGVEVIEAGTHRRSSRTLEEYEERQRSDGTEYVARKLTETEGDDGNFVAEVGGTRSETIYDEAGRELRISHGDRITTREYDPVGRKLREQTVEAGVITETIQFRYDAALGKVNWSRRTRAGKPTTTSAYDYDKRGNLVGAASSDGSAVALSYDANGRIATISDGQARVLRFKYNSISKPSEITLDGVGSITVTYTPSGEIKNVNSTAGRPIALQVTAAFQNLLDIVRPAGVSLTL